MRRMVVYRDGNQLAAQIGPDWVEGIAGFGDTVADARRSIDLAYSAKRLRLRLKRTASVRQPGTYRPARAYR